MSRVLPILFNTEMVQAILDGRKTVTRRICKDANEFTVPDMSFFDAEKRTYAVHNYADAEHTDKLSVAERTCPICPGDILYVRETWCSRYDGEKYFYLADKCTKREEKKLLDYGEVKWRPSIHMPKEAARIFLKVKDVRVERLQDITEKQAESEGLKFKAMYCPKDDTFVEIQNPSIDSGATYKNGFAKIWNSTIKKSDIEKYGWNANPWVWVIEFERCERPEEWK